MSMSHKAFAFDWNAFEHELALVLQVELDSNGGTELVKFIDDNRPYLTDPYEGEALPYNWRRMLTTGDLQELADVALTRYYRVDQDHGIGDHWIFI